MSSFFFNFKLIESLWKKENKYFSLYVLGNKKQYLIRHPQYEREVYIQYNLEK